MSKSNLPSIDYLRQCIRYDNGQLIWAESRPIEHFKADRAHKVWNKRFAGKLAGHTSKIGKYVRVVVSLDAKLYYRSILVWAVVNGRWPSGVVDHENRITTDDRIENLRDVTSSQNNMNRGISSVNTSGTKGVCWYARSKKWAAYIWKDKKNISLGRYYKIEDAIAARKLAEGKMHGEFSLKTSN